MPVGGNITFTCTHNGSSGRSLFWEYDIANRTATKFPIAAVSLRDEPGFSTSANGTTANPVNVTIYNLQLANNGSTVKCQLEQEGLPAVILVEGMVLHSICAPSTLCVRNYLYVRRVKNQLSATIYYRPPDPFNQWTNRLKQNIIRKHIHY